MSIWIFFKIIGSLALLIYGMKAMSEALQKMAGSQLRHILGTICLLYTSPSPRDLSTSRMPSSA